MGASSDLGREPAPDEATMCCFRHLLEAHDLDTRIFQEVYRHFEANCLKVAWGTIVDAMIINTPSSTKNAEGNQWYFSKKAHIGADSRSKIIHAVGATRRQCRGQHRAGRSTARRGDAAVGRPKPIAARLTSSERTHERAQLHQSKLPPSRRRRPGRAGQELHQVDGALQGRHAFHIIKRLFGPFRLRSPGLLML